MFGIPLQVTNGTFLRTKNYILTSLGHPQITVPISEQALNVSIENALEFWYMYMSHATQYISIDYWMFQTTKGQSLYPLDKCIDPAKIRSVIYNPQNYSLFNISFNQNFDFLFFTTSSQIPDLFTFFLALQKQETVDMILQGGGGTWDLVGSPPMLHLMPTPKGEINVAVVFAKLPDEQTIEKIGWIRRYALASAKTMLGEILSRYTNIPGAIGDMQLNGQTLKEEGNQEKEKLEEQLRQVSEIYAIHTDYEKY